MNVPSGQLNRDQIADELDRGSVVLIATDTLPGLHARIDRPGALARMRELKGRSGNKPFLVLASSWEDAWALVTPEVSHARSMVRRCWPGPFTFILPARDQLPAAVCAAAGTIAVRVPAPPDLRGLLADTGPLASSSANLAGQSPASSLAEAAARFPFLPVWGVPRGEPGGAASALVDLTGPRPVELRPGPLALPSWDGAS